MPFPLSQKLEINRLIEYSVDFSLCQRLNASFDWIFNGFGRFLIGRSIFARGSLSPGQGPTAPARKNASTDEETTKSIEYPIKWCIQSLAKGKIHWVFNQTIDFKLLRKGKRNWIHIFAYWSHNSTCHLNLERCLCTVCIVSFVA